MQRLRWRCHSKLLQGHRTKLKYLNMTNSPSNARFSWQRSRWTRSAPVSGGTQGATGYPWRMPAENSTRETQPTETRGHRGWIDVSAVRPVSTSQPHQPSDEASQQGYDSVEAAKSEANASRSNRRRQRTHCFRRLLDAQYIWERDQRWDRRRADQQSQYPSW